MPRAAPYTVHGYQLLDLIGEGTAGCVFRARRDPTTICRGTEPTDADVAIKIVPRAKVRDAVRREVGFHIDLNHPNIVPLHKVIPAAPPFHPSRSFPPSQPAALALVMDYARPGDMFTEVASAGALPARLLRRRLRDIASALDYLHKKKIVHLDIKLENVVINNSNTAQLIDFGCARHLDSRDVHECAPLGGTLHYLPPEVVEDARTIPTTASDAWSLGVLAYTALAGFYPFNAAMPEACERENDHATRHRIVNCHPHRLSSSVEMPSDLRRIIYGLLEKDPARRMTIPEVLKELSRSMEGATIGLFAKSSMHRRDLTRMDCLCQRPRSPASTTEADFAPCTCGARQSRKEALEIVDSIQRNRARAAAEVRRYFSDLSTGINPYATG